jgi:hypothetical protein
MITLAPCCAQFYWKSIVWKLNFIWIILHATWIELNSNSQMNSNILNGIMEFKFHWIKFKDKWDANWCKRYWKFAYDYSVRKKKTLKRQIWKDTSPFFFPWESIEDSLLWSCSTNNLRNLKLSNFNQIWWIIIFET